MTNAQLKAGFKILYYGIFAAVLAFGFAVGFVLIRLRVADDIHKGHYGGVIGVLCAAIALAILVIKNRKKVGR